ncbi:NlpC/P60 family protein, partial [Dickeya dianthicola]
MKFWRFWLILAALFLAGCSSHVPQSTRLGDASEVRTQLHAQLAKWRGTPYRYGGLDQNGIDCSGFVYLTFRDRFGLTLPRSTEEQT